MPDARKSFKKAVKNSQWQTFRDKSYDDPTFRKKNIINHLNNKAKRSHTMGAKALEAVWAKEGDPKSEEFNKAVQRTKSNNSDFGKKLLSSNAHLIKDFYDEVQNKKRGGTPAGTPQFQQRRFFTQMSHPNPNPNNVSVDEVDEYDETQPLRLKESNL